MTSYSRNTFREFVFSKDPERIDKGMELLKSTELRTIEDVFVEIGWTVMDDNSLQQRLWEHAYLTLFLLGVMHSFEVDWVIELEDVCVDGEGLTKIPDIFMNLTNLSCLDLSSNQLTHIPNSIGKMQNLTVLQLSNNPLEYLPNKLVSLHIDSEQWEIFQEQICNIQTLKFLVVYGNVSTTLPESFENLINLTSLAFISTNMATIPDSITNFINLKELDFQDGQLTHLSDSIGNLTNLKELYLDNNRLTNLPEAIGKLTNLTYLGLSGNPVSEPEQASIQTLLPNCDVCFK